MPTSAKAGNVHITTGPNQNYLARIVEGDERQRAALEAVIKAQITSGRFRDPTCPSGSGGQIAFQLAEGTINGWRRDNAKIRTPGAPPRVPTPLTQQQICQILAELLTEGIEIELDQLVLLS